MTEKYSSAWVRLKNCLIHYSLTYTHIVCIVCVYAKVPVYMSGQYLGAFLASLVLWGEYADLITMVSTDYIS